MEEVPLNKIRCGRFSKTGPGCFLSLQETDPKLEFICRDADSNEENYTSLLCRNISAIDLRVEAKFGSIEAMKGTLVVECLSPVLERRHHVLSPGESGGQNETSDLEIFIIESTFHVDETGAVRDMMKKLRTACSNKRKNSKKNDCPTDPKEGTCIFKEGLPNWVGFIPHCLYTRRVRQYMELAIFMYMVFSVTWALWQLYRHVDFVRESMLPLIEILQYQYRLLDNVVHVMNTIFEEYTIRWLCFIKPLYTVTTTLASPLWNILRQLSPAFQVVLQVLTTTWLGLSQVIKPFLSPGYQLLKFTFAFLRGMKAVTLRLRHTFYTISVPTIISAQFKSVKQIVGFLYYGLGQATQLDPLKAQLILVRSIVINSTKALGMGMVHLIRKIYKIIWLRRSAREIKKD